MIFFGSASFCFGHVLQICKCSKTVSISEHQLIQGSYFVNIVVSFPMILQLVQPNLMSLICIQTMQISDKKREVGVDDSIVFVVCFSFNLRGFTMVH